MKLLIELHYLPSLEYFCILSQFNEIILEKHEHFVKQSFRNRCQIKTSQGIETLIIPLTGKHGKVAIQNVRIDYSQKWQNNHWRAIESAYRKAPYFEYYADDLKSIIYNNHELLYELNQEILSFCLKCLKAAPELMTSVSYEKIPANGIFDARGLIESKKPYSMRSFYKPTPYPQVFGNRFAENLSLIDLLFCEGPNANRVLLASSKENLNK